MDENDLSQLLAFIHGQGAHKFLGPGISSYPEGDENNKRIHVGCLALEKSGLIYREKDGGDYVLWMPVVDV